MKGLYKLIFLGVALFVFASPASAVTSIDGCVNWNAYCEGLSIAVGLGWNPLNQAAVNEFRSDCTLSSASYTVNIIGVGSVGVGGLTTYTWRPLNPNTVYQWKVISNYQCNLPYRTGSISTILYSFTTPDCNQPPIKPTTLETWNHCTFQELSLPTFHWIYSDPDSDPQQAYEIRIDNDSSFTIPDPEEMTASGGASTAYTPLSVSWRAWANWNTNYWWIVRVKDSHNNWSPWSDANIFLTPDHAYPWPDFNWTPEEPAEGEVVVFNPDLTQVYGGASISSYLWTITHGTGIYVEGTTNSSQYPNVLFSTTDNRMKVQITDSSGYSCQSSEKDIFLTMPLPEYKEIPPVSFWQKIFSMILNFFKV